MASLVELAVCNENVPSYYACFIKRGPNRAYGELKMRLAKEHPNDRIAYTDAKGAFIREITAKGKRAAFA